MLPVNQSDNVEIIRDKNVIRLEVSMAKERTQQLSDGSRAGVTLRYASSE